MAASAEPMAKVMEMVLIDVDAHELRGALVLGAGAHGLAHFRLAGEEGQRDHDDDAGGDRDKRGYADGHFAVEQMNGGVAENGREDLGVRRPEQLRGVLQEIAHADGGDEHGQRRRGAQGLIGESLDENAERCADQHGQQDADERGADQKLETAKKQIYAPTMMISPWAKFSILAMP